MTGGLNKSIWYWHRLSQASDVSSDPWSFLAIELTFAHWSLALQQLDCGWRCCFILILDYVSVFGPALDWFSLSLKVVLGLLKTCCPEYLLGILYSCVAVRLSLHCASSFKDSLHDCPLCCCIICIKIWPMCFFYRHLAFVKSIKGNVNNS